MLVLSKTRSKPTLRLSNVSEVILVIFIPMGWFHNTTLKSLCAGQAGPAPLCFCRVYWGHLQCPPGLGCWASQPPPWPPTPYVCSIVLWCHGCSQGDTLNPQKVVSPSWVKSSVASLQPQGLPELTGSLAQHPRPIPEDPGHAPWGVLCPSGPIFDTTSCWEVSQTPNNLTLIYFLQTCLLTLLRQTLRELGPGYTHELKK